MKILTIALDDNINYKTAITIIIVVGENADPGTLEIGVRGYGMWYVTSHLFLAMGYKGVRQYGMWCVTQDCVAPILRGSIFRKTESFQCIKYANEQQKSNH